MAANKNSLVQTALIVVVMCMMAANLVAGESHPTVEFGGTSYSLNPFVVPESNPGQIYNLNGAKANTGPKSSNGPLTENIEELETAVIFFSRTDKGMHLNLIFDDDQNRHPGTPRRKKDAKAHIEVRCRHRDQPTDSWQDGNAHCKTIFSNNGAAACDDNGECDIADLGTGYFKVGGWKWQPNFTDGLVTGQFNSGCNEVKIRVKNDVNSFHPNGRLKKISVVSRDPMDGRKPVFLNPNSPGNIDDEITINFCVQPAPVTCDGGVAFSRGDPHFQTMDGLRYNYQGRGTHLFCAPKNGDMVIQACHQDRFAGSSAATNRAVIVQVRRDSDTLFFGVNSDGDFKILLNRATGVVEDLTTFSGSVVLLDNGKVFGTFSGASSRITVTQTNGWRLELRGRVGRTMLVDILSFHGPNSENPGTSGLCGDYNCLTANEFVKPDETIAANPNEFGFSWKVPQNDNLFINAFGSEYKTDTCDESLTQPPTGGGALIPDCQNPQNANVTAACDCCSAKCGSNCLPQDVADCVFDVYQGLQAGDDLQEVCDNTETPTCSPTCELPQLCEDGQCSCPNGIGTKENGCLPDICEPSTPGVSRGDPHFITIDGLRYDFQGRGLYTFCQTADVEVQTCQVDRHPSSTASINGAIAMKAGGDIFQLFKDSTGNFVTKVNGVPTSFSSTQVTLSGGATVVRSNNRYTVQFNGNRLVATVRSNRVIDAKFFPSSTATTSGLCGSNDCDRTNDFYVKGTSAVAASADDFGNSYEVPAGDDLFANSGYTCNPNPLPPPPPGTGPPPTCDTPDALGICTCCASKGFTVQQDFEDCVFDLHQVAIAATAANEDPEAAVATACQEEVPPACPENCGGECLEPGVCSCPGGGVAPACIPPVCKTDTHTYSGPNGSPYTASSNDNCVCLSFE